MKSFDKGFLTGGDRGIEWMLPWFISNYKKHNKKIPIAFCDFGLSDAGKKFVDHHFDYVYQLKSIKNGWFNKPHAMMASPFEQTTWLDTDCEILGDISSIFKYMKPNKLNMVCDRPWTKRTGETWYNSGVVGFIEKPEILKKWVDAIHDNINGRGDQEILHFNVLGNQINQLIYIEELPNIYNWLRLQLHNDHENSDKKLIVHWTGIKGKDVIRDKIKCLLEE